ncbi:MAG: 16S rRNA (guanine(527)-N(7))-methyltransferase RsmG [Actinomycetia bacterium]|nr:16S rRNA (guanine(527)-N(7))-methyltransferase RsmG [Actinomycetes bacterium]
MKQPTSVPSLPAPPEVRVRFGTATAKAERYAGWLAGPGVERGLLGPREVDRIWGRHLLNCAVLDQYLPRGSSVCDLGSGAGLPGLVLALLRPDCSMVLLEPLLRRATFLEEVVADLEISGVTVARARAEDYASQDRRHDAVVARAVAPLDRLVGWAMPLLRPGGVLLAQKGAAAFDELEAARPALDRWGVGERDVLVVAEGGSVTYIVRVARPLHPPRTQRPAEDE